MQYYEDSLIIAMVSFALGDAVGTSTERTRRGTSFRIGSHAPGCLSSARAGRFFCNAVLQISVDGTIALAAALVLPLSLPLLLESHKEVSAVRLQLTQVT